MAFSLRMSEEIGDWLTELRRTDPEAALRTGRDLAALMIAEGPAGPGLSLPVVPAGYDRLDPAESLDVAYQRLLEDLRGPRVRLAEAATEVKRAESRIVDLASRQAAGEEPRAGADLAESLRLLPDLREAERERSRQVDAAQRKLDDFRIKKETLKATYLAARTEVTISQYADSDSSAARARLDEITGKIGLELGWEPPAQGLAELRADPLGAGLTILFAVEPPRAVLLIAVVEQAGDAGQYAEAVRAASGVLRAARAGTDPEASALSFDSPAEFAAWLLPDRAAEVEAGAAELAASFRGRTLAEQRERAGLTQAQVAARMGGPAEVVAEIERAVSGAIEIRTLAAYVNALGGRMEIIADFGGERVTLR